MTCDFVLECVSCDPRVPLYMSKKGPIWQFFVLPLLAFRDRLFKNSQIVPFLPWVGVENPFKQWGKTHFCQIGPFLPPPQGPLQRSKLENRENDIFGVKKCLFGGPPWNHLMGFLGHLLPSLGKDLVLREGVECPKSPFKWFQGGPPKRHFLTPKMSFSRFSNFDLCRGTLGSQCVSWEISFQSHKLMFSELVLQ